jgi:hypothetical protein
MGFPPLVGGYTVLPPRGEAMPSKHGDPEGISSIAVVHNFKIRIRNSSSRQESFRF